MLRAVLDSPTAVRVNLEIMRTFVRLRRRMAAPGERVEQRRRLAETVPVHYGQNKQIVQVLKHQPAEPNQPRRRIGLHAGQADQAANERNDASTETAVSAEAAAIPRIKIGAHVMRAP
jgi:hypothetical protein